MPAHRCQNGGLLPPSKLLYGGTCFPFYASKEQLKNSTMSMGNAVDGFE
jgi:hypothetical protein